MLDLYRDGYNAEEREAMANAELAAICHTNQYESKARSLNGHQDENCEPRTVFVNVDEDDDDADDADVDYPDDDDRDFTEKEKEQVEYYKITSRYRGSYNENNEIKEEGEENGDDEVPYINGPYVITPEDFASSPPGYNCCPLDYYKDGVLADGWGVQMDVEETIGEEALDHFGEYVDDVVYVRNERLELDYEVTRDPRTYKEAERAYSDPNSQYT